jgi:pilus assembly protein CpaE
MAGPIRTGPIRTLVVLDQGITEDQVMSSLPGDSDVEIVTVVEGVDRAAKLLGDTPCDALLVACSGYSERVLIFTETAARVDPERPVIVLSTGSPNGFVRRVFEVGADDIIGIPQPADAVRFAIQKAIARRQSASLRGEGGLARLVVVLGPKGGTGKTLTATNLAVAMQEAGSKVALVDLDLQFGDIALCMGLPPDHTIHDLALDGGAIDLPTVERFMMTHASGVKVLVAPSRPDQAATVSVEVVREVYAALRPSYDVVVVDTPPGFTPEVIASIDMSTDLVMVGMLDSLSLKNTKLGLETLELMRYNPESVRVVLNRAHSRVGISTSTVGRVLGREPDVLVPSDREVPRTINEGVPIVTALPRSEAAEAFRGLAAFYNDDVEVVEPQPDAEPVAAAPSRGRLFGRRSS